MGVRESPRTFTFIIQANDSGALTGRNKSDLNSHIARRGASLRRQEQKLLALRQVRSTTSGSTSSKSDYAFTPRVLKVSVSKQGFDVVSRGPSSESDDDIGTICTYASLQELFLRKDPLPIYLQGALDPFCRLACDATAAERLLLQYYLSELPRLLYGTSPGAVICPVRMHTIPSLQTQPLWVKWVILNAEAHLIARRRISPTVSFFQRKASIYRALNEALADPRRRYADETIVGLGAASVMESRSSNPAAMLIHLKGYDTVRRDIFWQQSGSKIKPLIEWMWSPFVGAYIPPAKLQVHDLGELDEASTLFFKAVRTMQNWHKELDGMGQSKSHDEEMSQSYRALLRETVQTFTVRHFFALSAEIVNSAEQRERVVILLTLNTLLYHLRDRPFHTAQFLHGLRNAVEGSGVVNPRTGKSTLKIGAVRFFLNYLEMRLSAGGEGAENWSVLPVGHTCIAGMKVLGYLSDRDSRRVLRLFEGWLLGERCGGVEGWVSEEELEGLKAEVEVRWQAGCKGLRKLR